MQYYSSLKDFIKTNKVKEYSFQPDFYVYGDNKTSRFLAKLRSEGTVILNSRNKQIKDMKLFCLNFSDEIFKTFLKNSSNVSVYTTEEDRIYRVGGKPKDSVYYANSYVYFDFTLYKDGNKINIRLKSIEV